MTKSPKTKILIVFGITLKTNKYPKHNKRRFSRQFIKGSRIIKPKHNENKST